MKTKWLFFCSLPRKKNSWKPSIPNNVLFWLLLIALAHTDWENTCHAFSIRPFQLKSRWKRKFIYSTVNDCEFDEEKERRWAKKWRRSKNPSFFYSECVRRFRVYLYSWGGEVHVDELFGILMETRQLRLIRRFDHKKPPKLVEVNWR